MSKYVHLQSVPQVLKQNQIVSLQTNGATAFTQIKYILRQHLDPHTSTMSVLCEAFGHFRIVRSLKTNVIQNEQMCLFGWKQVFINRNRKIIFLFIFFHFILHELKKMYKSYNVIRYRIHHMFPIFLYTFYKKAFPTGFGFFFLNLDTQKAEFSHQERGVFYQHHSKPFLK